MGFIEDIARQNVEKENAERIANEKRRLDLLEQERKEKIRKAEADEIEKQRPKDYSEYGQKAKMYFEESGLRIILNKLVNAKAGTISESNLKDQSIQKAKRDYDMVFDVTFNFPDGRHYVFIRTSVDGDISFNDGINGNGRWNNGEHVRRKEWKSNKGVLENALRTAYEHPLIGDTGWHGGGTGGEQSDWSFCLPGNSLISVSSGFAPVKDLKNGDLVWTIDKFRHKVQAVILQKMRRLVSKDRKMVHIVLEDDRKLIASPGHPTIDNKKIGNLSRGQILDSSKIVSIQIMPYKEKYTYDILPSGETGGYWANGILIGSTLSNKFKKMQQNKITSRAVQI